MYSRRGRLWRDDCIPDENGALTKYNNNKETLDGLLNTMEKHVKEIHGIVVFLKKQEML